MERQRKPVRKIEWDLANIPPDKGFELIERFTSAEGGKVPIAEMLPFMGLAAGDLDPPPHFGEYLAGINDFSQMIGDAMSGGDREDPLV